MDRRRFLQASSAAAGYALIPLSVSWATGSSGDAAAQRGCLLYIDARLEKRADALRDRMHSAASTSPLLSSLVGSRPMLRFEGGLVEGHSVEVLAYNHVILVGFADDPLVQLAWQREAIIADGSIYVFGFGSFHGSLGYIESDRNPLLHAAAIPTTPYETQLITITGTDPDGIDLAFNAFLKQGLVNGLVAKQGWRRSSPTLLDRDPLPPSFTLPPVLPMSLGPLARIAVTQASRDEFRGVLADTGIEPTSIWRGKYYQPGEWDAPGLIASFHNYAVGLHRRSYGNTVWVAAFASSVIAEGAGKAIANAAKLKLNSSGWSGMLPPYAWGEAAEGDAPTAGTIQLWVNSEYVLMSTRTAKL